MMFNDNEADPTANGGSLSAEQMAEHGCSRNSRLHVPKKRN